MQPFRPMWKEVAHTADWALHVQAPDVAALLITAAQGMYALMDIRIANSPELTQDIHVSAGDVESLLVGFLNELLFRAEEQRMAFTGFDLTWQNGELNGHLHGGRITRQFKEIKAVTYHNMRVSAGPAGLETTVVFDV